MKRTLLIVGTLLALVATLMIVSILVRLSRPGGSARSTSRQVRSENTSSMPGETTAPGPFFKEKPSEETWKQWLAGRKRAKEAQEKALLAPFSTPINFWGKVVDQYGEPVERASVRFAANDKYWESGSKYTTQTDAQGLFSLRNAKGISLSVDVEKAGYYRNPQSYAAFAYASRGAARDRPVPTLQNPALFVLHKMGAPIPLFHVERRCFRLPKDGSPIEVSLETGRVVNPGHVEVQCWTNDQTKDPQGRYDWKCRVTVPSGGLIERTGSFDFEAPAEGCHESIDLVPSPERWTSHVEREYFVKLADGRYARISFCMRTGGDHFCVIESYMNPEPGSRNLEFDPSRPIKSRSEGKTRHR